MQGYPLSCQANPTLLPLLGRMVTHTILPPFRQAQVLYRPPCGRWHVGAPICSHTRCSQIGVVPLHYDLPGWDLPLTA